MSSGKRIHVAVGVLRRDNGDILIAKRSDSAHQGGLWEFPGGKREQGEHILQALEREFQEELGVQIDPQHCAHLIDIHHDYPDKSVHLDVWCIDGFSGKPEGREGQPLCWVKLPELNSYPFPQANQAIIDALHHACGQ